jgi:coenzyme PQQ precursor peptide PqqA
MDGKSHQLAVAAGGRQHVTSSLLAIRPARRGEANPAFRARAREAIDRPSLYLQHNGIFAISFCTATRNRRNNSLANFYNRISLYGRAKIVPHGKETVMSWKTPKIVEVPVGMEINMYACAARK